MALTSTLGRSTTWHTTCEGEGRGRGRGRNQGEGWNEALEGVYTFVKGVRCWHIHLTDTSLPVFLRFFLMHLMKKPDCLQELNLLRDLCIGIVHVMCHTMGLVLASLSI